MCLSIGNNSILRGTTYEYSEGEGIEQQLQNVLTVRGCIQIGKKINAFTCFTENDLKDTYAKMKVSWTNKGSVFLPHFNLQQNKLALVLIQRGDSLFSPHHPSIHALVYVYSKCYSVAVHCIDQASEIKKHINEHAARNFQVCVLHLGCHGDTGRLQLTGTRISNQSNPYLDPLFQDMCLDPTYFVHLAPNATIVLDGCSVGEKLAQHVIQNTCGNVKVYAAKEDTGAMSMIIPSVEPLLLVMYDKQQHNATVVKQVIKTSPSDLSTSKSSTYLPIAHRLQALDISPKTLPEVFCILPKKLKQLGFSITSFSAYNVSNEILQCVGTCIEQKHFQQAERKIDAIPIPSLRDEVLCKLAKKLLTAHQCQESIRVVQKVVDIGFYMHIVAHYTQYFFSSPSYQARRIQKAIKDIVRRVQDSVGDICHDQVVSLIVHTAIQPPSSKRLSYAIRWVQEIKNPWMRDREFCMIGYRVSGIPDHLSIAQVCAQKISQRSVKDLVYLKLCMIYLNAQNMEMAEKMNACISDASGLRKSQVAIKQCDNSPIRLQKNICNDTVALRWNLIKTYSQNI